MRSQPIYGYHEPRPRRPFWEFNVGHLMVLLGMLGSVFAVWQKSQNDLAVLTNDIAWIKRELMFRRGDPARE